MRNIDAVLCAKLQCLSDSGVTKVAGCCDGDRFSRKQTCIISEIPWESDRGWKKVKGRGFQGKRTSLNLSLAQWHQSACARGFR